MKRRRLLDPAFIQTAARFVPVLAVNDVEVSLRHLGDARRRTECLKRQIGELEASLTYEASERKPLGSYSPRRLPDA